MSSNPESDIIRRCRQGEAAAWDELFDQHYAPAARFIFQLGHDFTWEDAEEIAQEVFLSVIKNLASFRGQSRFQTWIFRIAVNQARDYRQKRNAAKRGGGHAPISLHADNGEPGLAIDPPSAAPGPDRVLMNAERAALLHDALQQLGDPCRELLELRYFGDLSHDEISRTLEMNPKTVSSSLSKCLDRLEALARRAFSGAKLADLPSNH